MDKKDVPDKVQKDQGYNQQYMLDLDAYIEKDLLDWDAHIETPPPPYRVDIIQATFRCIGPSKPIPVKDPFA